MLTSNFDILEIQVAFFIDTWSNDFKDGGSFFLLSLVLLLLPLLKLDANLKNFAFSLSTLAQ